MIRWCSYCQLFLGESPPFDSPVITHGICARCDEQLEHDAPVMQSTEAARALMARMFKSASNGDERACATFIAEAHALNLGTESVLVGMLQPALYQAGLDWQDARMSVAAEHRFTSWCDRVFALLTPRARPPAQVDVLIFQTPGNEHTLGPRFAAEVLAARGLSVEAIVPALPLEEVVALATERRPRMIGFSCALPASVPVATEVIARLRTRLGPRVNCRYLVSGFAFRLGGGAAPPEVPPDIDVAIHLESVVALLASAC